MNLNKKMSSSKPHLFIEIEDYSESPQAQKEIGFKNEVALKPLRSAKNLHELRKFNFDEDQIECNTSRQLRRLRKLQEEKVNLMQSLQILKASAVSAIAEKEEEIDHLRQHQEYEDDDEFYERELERSKKIRLQLEEQRQQLHREMHTERKKYIEELQEREDLIDTLYGEIQEVRRELSALEEFNEAKTKKIKLLQQQNSRLSDQLQLSSIATTLRERTEQKNETIIDLDETIKIQPALSATSSIPCKSYVSYIDSQRYFQSEADRSYLTQKLEEVEKMHKEELLDLKSFYEKRIQGLRQIYQRQLHLQTEQSQQGTIRSRRDSQTSTPGMKKQSSKKQLDSALQLNLKDMYSIEESVQNQLETSRSKMLNLRHQIKMQNLSECPSLQPRMFSTNDDAESQFTTKYFDVTNKFVLKRNRSNDTFNTIQEQDSKTMVKSSTTMEEKGHTQETSVQEKESLLKKSCIFAAGLISGATITSVLGYFLKKR